MSTTLCLDPGTAHTGLALSEEGILVTPLTTIFERNIDSLVGKLTPFLAKINPDTLVIGIPEHGPLVEFSQDLADRLKDIYSGEIVLFPENLSSSLARRKMREAGKTLAKKKRDEHQTAAAIILEDYLESI
jgi:putative transcription antitermination factor YqgF